MFIHDETDSVSLTALLMDPSALIERARSVSEFDRTSAPVAVYLPFLSETTVGHVHFYADRESLDEDMEDMAACTYISAIEVIAIAPDGVCAVIS